MRIFYLEDSLNSKVSDEKLEILIILSTKFQPYQ